MTSIGRFTPRSTAEIFRVGNCFEGCCCALCGARYAVPAGAIMLARRPPFRRAESGLKGEEAGTSIIERGDDAIDGVAGFSVVRSTICVGCVKYGDCEMMQSSSSLSSEMSRTAVEGRPVRAREEERTIVEQLTNQKTWDTLVKISWRKGLQRGGLERSPGILLFGWLVICGHR